MSMDQEKGKIKQAMSDMESDFLKRKRLFEEQEEELMYGRDRTNRSFDDLAESTSYYLRKFEVEDHEFRIAMSIIEVNKADLLTEIKQEQKNLESIFEDENYDYKKQRDRLEDQLLSVRSE
ncbi:hypothetical protein A5821_001319 [Enterococcus sp. 7F3_DIV0205]|uniref:Uncharacterized protein n=1 Tax=Candidatus Enterococcus palustris TaxID=1834189 RepID=A0AAQ3W7M4_9ENTE|nr:hypothetical protein [Enterococcus sp. 7F3_DIV0205]OTN85717.1 hypothetical protein A5821_001663 [Enterococcus sp. 7F3_DIV0205]